MTSVTTQTRSDIPAIIGYAIRCPGADTPAELWALLMAGTCAVGDIPQSVIPNHMIHGYADVPGKSARLRGGMVSGRDTFDAAYFGISPREARQMNAQQRVMLEVVTDAIHHAGLLPEDIGTPTTGIFVGFGDATSAVADIDKRRIGTAAGIGHDATAFANRLSYVFNAGGPSVPTSTACSASLTALHLAATSLASGEIDTAIVAGVSLFNSVQQHLFMEKAGLFSPSGLCQAFDAKADGYVRAEGVGAIVLRRSDLAQASGDHIHALLVGTGANSAGRSQGISQPNEAAQRRLFQSVIDRHGIDPTDVAYVEAHGTGTRVGDPIECNAIGAVYGTVTGPDRPLAIGSVKTNLGHMEAAAGMGGLLKALLVLEHGIIPPTIHIDTLNPAIDFAGLNLAPTREATPLTSRSDRAALIAVNSFGFGGANAHAVLAPAPTCPGIIQPMPLHRLLLPISAKTSQALNSSLEKHTTMLEKTQKADIPGLVHTALHRREGMDERAIIVARDPAGLNAGLAALNQDSAPSEDADFATAKGTRITQGKVAFVFSGNGPQWHAMGRELLGVEGPFRDRLLAIDALFEPLAGFSIVQTLASGEDLDVMSGTDIAQPCLFALQLGLVDELAARGITATGAIGHSVGEVAAAVHTGQLSLEDGVHVIHHRSKLQHLTAGQGKMAALGLGYDAASDYVATVPNVVVAGDNGPDASTIAGSAEELEKLAARAAQDGIDLRMLRLDYAFHSPAMDPIEKPLIEALGDIAPKTGSGTFLSTVTGDGLDGTALDAEYWWRNVREPVLFRQAIGKALDAGFDTFIEIGPHPVLRAYVNSIARKHDTPFAVLSTLTRRAPESHALDQLTADAYVAGVAPDLRDVLSAAPVVALPPYPFAKDKIEEPREDRREDRKHAILGRRTDYGTDAWESDLSLAMHPYLEGHVVQGKVLVPAAFMIETALELGDVVFEGSPFEIIDFAVLRGIVMRPDETLRYRTMFDAVLGFSIETRPSNNEVAPWTICATGRIQPLPEPGMQSTSALVLPSEAVHFSSHILYQTASKIGFEYSGTFRGVEAFAKTDREMNVILSTDAPAFPAHSAAREETKPLVHPAVIDWGLQGPIGFWADQDTGQLLLPSGVERIRMAAGGQPRTVEVVRYPRVGMTDRFDFTYRDEAGQVVLKVDGYTCVVMLKSARDMEAPRHRQVLECDLRFDALPAFSPSSLLLDTTAAYFGTSDAVENWLSLEATRLLSTLSTELGCPVDQLSEADAFDPTYAPLLELLSEASAKDSTASDEQWRLAVAQWPGALGDLENQSKMSDMLPAILTEEVDDLGHYASEIALKTLTNLRTNSAFDQPLGDTLITVFDRLLSALPARRPVKVLVIGASRCPILERLANRGMSNDVGQAIHLTLTDDSDETLAEAMATVAHAAVTGVVVNPAAVADFATLDTAFDIIIVTDQVQEVADVATTLRAVGTHLTSGGVMLAGWHRPSVFGALVQGGRRAMWDMTDGRSHAWDAADGITDIFAQDGFEVASVLVEGVAPACVALAVAPVVITGEQPKAARDCEKITVISLDATQNPLAEPICAAFKPHCDEVVSIDMPTDPSHVPSAQHELVFSDAIKDATHLVVVLPEPTEGPLDTGLALSRISNAALAQDTPPRVTVVCRNIFGDPEEPHVPVHPGHALAWGFARSLCIEAYALKLRRIDVSAIDAQSACALAPRIVDTVLSPLAEDEFLITANARFVTRITPLDTGSPVEEIAQAPDYAAGLSGSNSLSSYEWRVFAPRPLAPQDVSVRIKASGLNYKDVLFALGVLPAKLMHEGAVGPAVGLEYAGVVEAVGAEVTDLAAGDLVSGMAFGQAGLANSIQLDSRFVMKRPPEWSHTDAATMPVVFNTAWYALHHLARLGAGDTLLVHGGAGGVGQAAIQIAQAAGARIIATAGSPERRGILQRQGVDHVFDSRNLGFVEDIRRVTNGRGVEVALNALAGPQMRATLECMAPFGRFLEIGKRDFLSDQPLGLGALTNNISYHAIDLEQMVEFAPERLMHLLEEVRDAAFAGTIRPLPSRVFEPAAIATAADHLRKSAAVGKVVIRHEDRPPLVPFAAEGAFSVRPDRTVLVTGGTRGFGLKTAQWLVARGARHLCLVSLTGKLSPEGEAFVKTAQQSGVTVIVVAADISAEDGVKRALDAAEQNGMPPLCGIVHAATLYGDSAAANLDPSAHTKVVGAKAHSAFHFDRLTRGITLDFFVLYSSIASSVGSEGQASYASANAYLDALATARRQAGHTVLVVNWGGLEDAGELTSNALARATLTQGDDKLTSTDAALSQLGNALASGLTDVGIGHLPRTRLVSGLKRLATGRLNRVAPAADQAEDASELDWRQIEDATARRTTFDALMLQLMSEALQLPVDRFNTRKTLVEHGLDSLMSIQLSFTFEDTLSIRLQDSGWLQITSIEDVFEGLYSLALATSDDGQEQISETQDTGSVPQDDLPLTLAQSRYYEIERNAQDPSAAFNVVIAVDVEGHVDSDLLSHALESTVNAHGILRSVIAQTPNGAVMRETDAEIALEIEDVPPHIVQDSTLLDARISEWVRSPFDLHNGPLFKAKLMRLSSTHCVVLMGGHHIAIDGLSLTLILRALLEEYVVGQLGLRSVPSRPHLNFREFAVKQNAISPDLALASAQAKWGNIFAKPTPAGSLASIPAVDRDSVAQNNQNSLKGDTHFFEMSTKTNDALHRAARGLSVTPFVLIVSGLVLQIQRETGLNRFVIATVDSARGPSQDWAMTIGPIANRIPLVIDLPDGADVETIVQHVNSVVDHARRYADTPFELIHQVAVEQSAAAADETLYKIQIAFHTMAQLANIPPQTGIRATLRPVSRQAARYDLAFDLWQGQDGTLSGQLEFDTTLYSKPAARSICDTLITTLDEIINN